MSSTNIIKFGSVLLVIASLAAAFVGWVALSAVWASASLTPGVGDATTSARTLLAATDETLTEVRSALSLVGSVTDNVAAETEAAAASLDEVAGLLNERIPNALAAVESSLPALTETASVIEDTMQALSVFGIPYDPPVPFDEALLDLGNELDGLPEAVAQQGANLDDLVPAIRQTGEDAGELSGHLDAIDLSLGEAQRAVGEFTVTVGDVEESARLGSRLVQVIPTARVAVLILALAGVALGVVAWILADRLAARTVPAYVSVTAGASRDTREH
jgi:hypothetical protein